MNTKSHAYMRALWTLDLLKVSSHRGVSLGHCRTLLALATHLLLSVSDCVKGFETESLEVI